jgi:hypothetical protein
VGLRADVAIGLVIVDIGDILLLAAVFSVWDVELGLLIVALAGGDLVLLAVGAALVILYRTVALLAVVFLV